MTRSSRDLTATSLLYVVGIPAAGYVTGFGLVLIPVLACVWARKVGVPWWHGLLTVVPFLGLIFWARIAWRYGHLDDDPYWRVGPETSFGKPAGEPRREK
jgi:hypothetical protein